MTRCYPHTPSSEKLILAQDGASHKNPQLVNMQRIRNLGVLSSKWYICVTLAPKVQGSIRKSGQRNYKTKNWKLCFLDIMGQLST